MKAFLLAAGLGTRLAPLTDHTPKCMLPIDGRPLLDIWLDEFDRAGVDEVLVNLHSHADVVRDHLARRAGPPHVVTFFEPELLGSAGTLLARRDWVEGEEFFLACNADNLTDLDLTSLIEFHRQGDAVATLTLFHAPQPSACGIVELDDGGRVVGFSEKPARPVSDLANAGIYAFHSRLLDDVEGETPLDIGFHLLPGLVGRARALEISGYFRDIGTAEAYRLAQQEWRPRVAP
jgi:mannose-1-phosphate guanylyltransferase